MVLALFTVGNVYASLCKKAFTLHLSRSEGHERYFGCNLMHRKALASSHQHLVAEAPNGEKQIGRAYGAPRQPSTLPPDGGSRD